MTTDACLNWRHHHSRNERNVSITATHIGVKLISAEPMTRLAYNQFHYLNQQSAEPEDQA